MEQDLEEDYAFFDHYFEQNKLEEGAAVLLKRIKNYERERPFPEKDQERLQHISAVIFYCRFLLLQGKNQEVKERLTRLNDAHEVFLGLGQHHRLKAELQHNFGELLFRQGHYLDSIVHVETAVDLKKHSNDFKSKEWQKISIGQSLVVLGKGHWKKGDFHTALLCYYEAYINYQDSTKSPKIYLIGRVLVLIAEVFVSLKMIPKAIRLLNRVLELFEGLPENHIYVGGVKCFLAECLFKHQEVADFERSEHLILEASKAIEQTFPDLKHRYVANIKNIYANWCLMKEMQQEGRKPSADSIHKQFKFVLDSMQGVQGISPGKKSINYNQISSYLYQNGHYQQALESAQTAIHHLIPEVKEYLHESNPSIQQLKQISRGEYSILLESLLYKARALYALQPKSISNLHLALDALSKARTLIQFIRKDIFAAEARLEWSGNVRPVFELYIEICHALLTLEPEHVEKRKEELFELLPDCHAAYLLETILIPESDRMLDWLYDGDENANSVLKDIEDKLVEPNYKISRKAYTQLVQYITKRRKVIEERMRSIKGQVKEVSQFETDTPFTLHNFIALFDRQEPGAAVYYFIHQERGIYTFVISGDQQSFELFLIPFNKNSFANAAALNASIEKLMETLNSKMAYHGPTDGLNDQKHHIPFYAAIAYAKKRSFVEASTRLYDFLIRPLMIKGGLIDTKRIYFIGDQHLAFLPFEVLLQGEAESLVLDPYKEMPFLIRDFKISYHASISALFTLHKVNEGAKGLESRPVVHKKIKSCIQIIAGEIHNKQIIHTKEMRNVAEGCAEVLNRNGRKSKKLYLRNKSKKFLSRLHEYDLVHIIAHTTGPPRNPGKKRSLILMRDMDNDKPHAPEVLLAPEEIVNERFDLELVMLSTCGAGYGQSYLGESPITLSHAFLMANSKNVYFTFFEINQEFAKIMATLFLHFLLSEGENYVTAMQNAKLAMLFSEETAHPQLWAAPAFMGDQTLRIKFSR